MPVAGGNGTGYVPGLLVERLRDGVDPSGAVSVDGHGRGPDELVGERLDVVDAVAVRRDDRQRRTREDARVREGERGRDRPLDTARRAG